MNSNKRDAASQGVDPALLAALAADGVDVSSPAEVDRHLKELRRRYSIRAHGGDEAGAGPAPAAPNELLHTPIPPAAPGFISAIFSGLMKKMGFQRR